MTSGMWNVKECGTNPMNCEVVHAEMRSRSFARLRNGQFSHPLCVNCCTVLMSEQDMQALSLLCAISVGTTLTGMESCSSPMVDGDRTKMDCSWQGGGVAKLKEIVSEVTDKF